MAGSTEEEAGYELRVHIADSIRFQAVLALVGQIPPCKDLTCKATVSQLLPLAHHLHNAMPVTTGRHGDGDDSDGCSSMELTVNEMCGSQNICACPDYHWRIFTLARSMIRSTTRDRQFMYNQA
jgi:hypothetical protein